MSSITKVKSGYQARVRRKNYPTQVKNFQYRSDAKSWALATERAIATGTLAVAEGTLGKLLERYSSEITPTKRSSAIEALRIEKIKRSWDSEIPLKKLTATLCLTVALLFGCAGVCKSADPLNTLSAFSTCTYPQGHSLF